MRIFLDYCILNDAMRDASVLAKLRFMRKNGVEMVTSTTVIGEAVELLSDGPKEGHYILIDLLHDLKLRYAHPKRDWLKEQMALDEFLERRNAGFVPASERAHMAMAISYSTDLYMTSKAEARNLSQLEGLRDMLHVTDIDEAVALVRTSNAGP